MPRAKTLGECTIFSMMKDGMIGTGKRCLVLYKRRWRASQCKSHVSQQWTKKGDKVCHKKKKRLCLDIMDLPKGDGEGEAKAATAVEKKKEKAASPEPEKKQTAKQLKDGSFRVNDSKGKCLTAPPRRGRIQATDDDSKCGSYKPHGKFKGVFQSVDDPARCISFCRGWCGRGCRNNRRMKFQSGKTSGKVCLAWKRLKKYCIHLP